MKSIFHPRLINGPFDDPGLYIPFLFEKRAFLFDLGDISTLSSRDILKISHIFISHTHMDHFFGFDQLLRLFLGRGQPIYIYGPEGFLKNLTGRLSGYTWNLVQHYEIDFVIHAREIRNDVIFFQKYSCRNRFKPTGEMVREDVVGLSQSIHLLKEAALNVSCVILDHAIPCLGFSIQERFHINIIKDALLKLDLSVGPWLAKFKQALYAGHASDSPFKIQDNGSNISGKTFQLGELAAKIAKITRGQKIAYITDVVYSPENVDKIIEIVQAADHLFIEAVFLEQDRSSAAQKNHLTAYQAGKLAALAKVKQFSLFHYSPRYMGKEDCLRQEALRAFNAFSTAPSLE